MEVEVLRWNPYTTPETPTMRGFCKFLVRAGGLAFELNDVKLYENETGEWFQLPSRMYKNQDGETKFSSYFWWASRENYTEFKDAAMAALNETRGIAAEPISQARSVEAPAVVGQQPAQVPQKGGLTYDEIPF